MRATIASFVMFAIAAAISSDAFAGNGFAAIIQKPAGLSIFVIGVIIGAILVAVWRKFR
jgi:hypothetical protein